MAVIVRDNTNDALWNEWSKLLNAAIYDADANKVKYDEIVKALANVDSSSMYAEKAQTFGDLGDYAVKTEGANAVEDDFEQGYAKLIQHSTFSKSVVISRELRDDNRRQEAMQKVVNLVQSYKRTRAKFMTSALTLSVGSTTSMSFGGATIDISGADTLALFNSAHPLKRVTGATQCNHFSDAFGNNAAVLNELANRMRNFKNDRGEVMGYTADTIIIPGNAPALEETVKRIIGSEGEVGSNNNDINTQRGKWKLIVDELWTPTKAQTTDPDPYIIMSSEANKELLGTRFYDRTPLDVATEIKVESRNKVYNGYGRMSCGFTNWRHVILGGSTNADAQSL